MGDTPELSTCEVRPTPDNLINDPCDECGHALLVHDNSIGCVICDYLVWRAERNKAVPTD